MADGDYKVGYRKPPKNHQFRKGQSGNPKGRAKGSRNLETILREEMDRVVTVSEGGQRRKYTKLEIILRVMADKAATGNIAAFRELMKLLTSTLQTPAESQSAAGHTDPLEIPDAVFAEMLQVHMKGQGQ